LGLVYPLFGLGGFGPFAGDLSGGDVEAVPDIGHGDVQDEGGKLRFVVVTLGFVPNVVGDGVGTIAESCDGFGEREGGAFGIGEVGCVAPSGDGEEALHGFLRLLEAKAHVHADAATVDLAGAQMSERQGLRRDTCMFCGLSESLQVLYGVGQKCSQILNSCFHDGGSPFLSVRCPVPRACHKDWVPIVITLTKGIEKM